MRQQREIRLDIQRLKESAEQAVPSNKSTRGERRAHQMIIVEIAKLEVEMANVDYAQHSENMMLMGRFATEYLGEVGKRLNLHQARLSARQNLIQQEMHLENID